MEKLYSVIPENRIKAMVELLSKITVEGAVIEVGVYKGGSASYIVDVFPERRIYLADTFTGIPHTTHETDNDKDGPCHKVGFFHDTSIDAIIEAFDGDKDITLLEGIFPDDFRRVLENETFAVVHLDCDMYQSYKDSLEFLYPRTVKGGIIIMDDYQIQTAPGATSAVDEFFKDRPESIREYNEEYYIIKE